MSRLIYYVAGAARSGSTLLDIMVGSNPQHLSLGELFFFVQNGLLDNEYCSCGSRVRECRYWRRVELVWERHRTLSLTEFRMLQNKYLRNKSTCLNVWNFFFPSKSYQALIHDTRALYLSVLSSSDARGFVDSSKNAQMILILRRVGLPFKIIHLARSFDGVLSSTRKEFQKNPASGVERTLKAQKFSYSLFVWIVDNLLVVLFSLGKRRVYVKYEDLVSNPVKTLLKIYQVPDEERTKLEHRGPFQVGHLVAGNQLRMKKEVWLSGSESNFHRAGFLETAISKFLSLLYRA